MEASTVTDETLRNAILTAFAGDNRIAADNLRVGVLNSIAHLAGKVDDLSKRDLAETLAHQVPDIRGVVNRIDCPGAPSPARTVNLDLNQKIK
jgi:osmotically-inducible protein OsmY